MKKLLPLFFYPWQLGRRVVAKQLPTQRQDVINCTMRVQLIINHYKGTNTSTLFNTSYLGSSKMPKDL